MSRQILHTPAQRFSFYGAAVYHSNMSTYKPPLQPPSKANALMRSLTQNQRTREQTYRERALKMYPWICGRCAREFSGKRLSELTVHHKDHNHDNNPADGSNWELLCLYCHDNEHAKFGGYGADYDPHASSDSNTQKTAATHNPFAGLADLLGKPRH